MEQSWGSPSPHSPIQPRLRPSDVLLIENRKNCLAQLLELAVLPHRLFQIRPQFDSLLDGFRRSLEISVRAVYPGQVEISHAYLGSTSTDLRSASIDSFKLFD